MIKVKDLGDNRWKKQDQAGHKIKRNLIPLVLDDEPSLDGVGEGKSPEYADKYPAPEGQDFSLERVQRCEVYIGLAHAFLQAGARNLLVGLWRVEDEVPCLPVARFYENLTGAYVGDRAGSGKPMFKSEALREAKHWVVK